ncbi:MAG: hypothetical protein KAQ65_05515 [Candidatus Thorarchaeota archaeon]|nr:hypothetical protein [Candidatus Thorarchaeota archaeon]
MSEDGKESQSLEEEVFKTLGHQIRRDIIRIIGDNRGLRFTEIMSAINIEESASLSYHLNALGPLLLHDNGLYSLSELGKDTYSLLTKLVTYSASAATIGIIKQQLGATIIANTLMWASAILSMVILEGPLQFMTLAIFASLFSVSNIILYSIVQHTKV